MEAKNNNNKSIKIFLILSLVLNVALIGFLFVLNNKNNEKTAEIEQLTGTVSTKNEMIQAKLDEINDLGEDLKRIKEEREALGLSNDSLNQQIAQLDTYVAKLKKASALNAKERKELEEMVAKLREEITKKDAEIAQLKTANDSLTTNVNNLTVEKQKLGDSLNNTAKELAYASILKAENVKVTVLKENGKELDEAEYKHKNIDRIKITFGIADNKAAKKNTKKFYVALVPPSGKPFCDMNNGGGFCSLTDNSEVPYTLSQDLEFNNTNQKLTFTMFKGFNYAPGAYKVLVYSEGYKIGEGGFQVK